MVLWNLTVCSVFVALCILHVLCRLSENKDMVSGIVCVCVLTGESRHLGPALQPVRWQGSPPAETLCVYASLPEGQQRFTKCTSHRRALCCCTSEKSTARREGLAWIQETCKCSNAWCKYTIRAMRIVLVGLDFHSISIPVFHLRVYIIQKARTRWPLWNRVLSCLRGSLGCKRLHQLSLSFPSGRLFILSGDICFRSAAHTLPTSIQKQHNEWNRRQWGQRHWTRAVGRHQSWMDRHGEGEPGELGLRLLTVK